MFATILSYLRGLFRKPISINYHDLGIDYADIPPWRSYSLDTHGKTLDECLENATIEEIDQDGGTLRCYGVDDSEPNVYNEVVNTIKRRLNKC